MKRRQIIVVGGGASGLVAAISAAREGAEVTIIEQKDRVGKKILSTGNGRCNLTNEYMRPDCFRGDDMNIVSKILEQFGYKETIRFFEELGVVCKSRQGYMYPNSDQASTILDVLRMELERLNINVLTEQSVLDINKTTKGFYVTTTKGSLYADALILATGGKAAPSLGSDGSGYLLAKKFGHSISPVVPALVQLRAKGNEYKQVAGVRTQAKVSVYIEDMVVADDTGELQLTDYGFSGIPIFQISRFASKGLYEKKSVELEIDFVPTMTDKEFSEFIYNRVEHHGYKTAEDFLLGVFHKKLSGMLLKAAHIPLKSSIYSLENEQIEDLIHICKHFRDVITSTNDFSQAQICAGGVRTPEIDMATLESIYEDDLYLVGELLDVDGICGGYNLQWAWSTGFIAGKYAAKGKKYDSYRTSES